MRNFINLVESVTPTSPQVSEGAFSFMRGLAGKQAAPAPDNNPAAEPATSQPTSTPPVQPTREQEQEQDADRMMAHIARNLHGAGATDPRFAAGQIRELSRLSHILKGSSLADRINSFMHRQASKGLVLGNYTFQ